MGDELLGLALEYVGLKQKGKYLSIQVFPFRLVASKPLVDRHYLVTAWDHEELCRRSSGADFLVNCILVVVPAVLVVLFTKI